MQSRPDHTQIEPGGPPAAQYPVATYEAYTDAQAAVDALAERGFPVERVAIVGRGLCTVEQVTGRLNVLAAAGQGALSGAFVGAAFGVLLELFVVTDAAFVALALSGLVAGGVLGAMWAAGARWAVGGRHDFASVSSIVAARYDLVADADVARHAYELLSPVPAAALS